MEMNIETTILKYCDRHMTKREVVEIICTAYSFKIWHGSAAVDRLINEGRIAVKDGYLVSVKE